MSKTPKNSLEAMQAEIGTRKTVKPMFPHDVPETEPPIGTIAQFNMSFKSGSGMSTDMLIRTGAGWQKRPGTVQPMDVRSWQDLTDLEHMNFGIQRRNPGSSAEFVTVQVALIGKAL